MLLSQDRRKLTFQFATFGDRTGGIDFKVGPKAKTVAFHLNMNDDDNPRTILIGAAGVHPDKTRFMLPAHPESPSGTERPANP